METEKYVEKQFISTCPVLKNENNTNLSPIPLAMFQVIYSPLASAKWNGGPHSPAQDAS